MSVPFRAARIRMHLPSHRTPVPPRLCRPPWTRTQIRASTARRRLAPVPSAHRPLLARRRLHHPPSSSSDSSNNTEYTHRYRCPYRRRHHRFQMPQARSGFPPKRLTIATAAPTSPSQHRYHQRVLRTQSGGGGTPKTRTTSPGATARSTLPHPHPHLLAPPPHHHHHHSPPTRRQSLVRTPRSSASSSRRSRSRARPPSRRARSCGPTLRSRRPPLRCWR